VKTNGFAFYPHVPNESLTIANLNETISRLQAIRPRPFITDADIDLGLRTGIDPMICAEMRERSLPAWISPDFRH